MGETPSKERGRASDPSPAARRRVRRLVERVQVTFDRATARKLRAVADAGGWPLAEAVRVATAAGLPSAARQAAAEAREGGS